MMALLIIDDCEDDVIVLRHALREHSTEIELVWVNNPQDAIEVAQKRPYRLILIDLLFLRSGISGVELFKKLKDSIRSPMVGFSGLNPGSALVMEAKSAGLVVIKKPMTHEDLERLLT